MSYYDWLQQYSRMFICRLYTDSVGDIYYRYLLEGEWKGQTAGGKPNRFLFDLTFRRMHK